MAIGFTLPKYYVFLEVVPDTKQGIMIMKQNSTQRYNLFLTVFLWLNIFVTSLKLVEDVRNLLKWDSAIPYIIGSIFAVCVVWIGFFLLLKLRKSGFYMVVVGMLLNMAIAYAKYCHDIAGVDVNTLYGHTADRLIVLP